MKTSVTAFMAASAVLFFCGAASAGADPAALIKAPAAPAVTALQTELAASATEQAKAPCLEACDFDALSAAGDPLYREGSKELLKQAVEGDAAAKPEAKPASVPVLRDAPNSKPASAAPAAVPQVPHPAIKKPAGKKTGPADPVVIKNTL